MKSLANSQMSLILIFFFLSSLFFFISSNAATFEIRNECPYTVWAAASPGGGRRLDRGQSWNLNVAAGTKMARIWGRTNCKFDNSGRGRCATGDCGALECNGWGVPPNTLAEYALNQFGNMDFIDISLVDGFNIPMDFSPTSGGCRGIRCTADINGQCPGELKVPPQYTTFRSGLGHLPVFTGTVELAGITFTGEPAKNKKQAEKNAAMAAWSSLKQLKETASSSCESENSDELEQITIARALLRLKEKMAIGNPSALILFPRKFPIRSHRPTSPQPAPATTSRILPLICQKTAHRNRPPSTTANDSQVPPQQPPALEARGIRSQKFPAAGATPYVPIRQIRTPCHGMAPPVTIRNAVPVYSAPPLPPPSKLTSQMMRAPPVRFAPPVSIRQAIPVYAAPPVHKEDAPVVQKEDPPDVAAPAPAPASQLPALVEETGSTTTSNSHESETVQSLEQLKI